jgi:hypothetical protein
MDFGLRVEAFLPLVMVTFKQLPGFTAQLRAQEDLE